MILKNSTYILCIALTSISLTACSSMNPFKGKEDTPLTGKRISILELEHELKPDNTTYSQTQEYMPPQAWENEQWPQHGGYPTHAMQNLALDTSTLEQKWSVSIGKGATQRLPLTAQPIVTTDLIITLDTHASVKAFKRMNGDKAWETSTLPENEDEAAIGGGISYANNLLYVTNGFGEILALSPKDGQIKWRKSLSSPARAAPTSLTNTLYVQLLDNTLLALRTHDGSEIWRYSAFSENSGLVGAASPAANNDIVIAAFSSGEISHLDAAQGIVKWSHSLAPRRRLGGIGSLSDVIALPVIDHNSVYGIGFGGQMARYDLHTGQPAWQREIASIETPWVAGERLFVTTLDNQLASIDKQSGNILWITDLKTIKGAKKSEIWTGPIMGNGNILVASSGGKVVEISAKDGKLLQIYKAPGPVSIPPVIAGKTLYVLSDNGKLAAYQ
jgi:outer membrane protein assembly factor BamB